MAKKELVAFSKLQTINPTHIRIDGNNGRLTETPIDELVESIKAFGFIGAIGVMQASTNDFILMYGARRLRAFKEVFPGLPIPCHVYPNTTNIELHRLAENLGRRGLTPAEVAMTSWRESSEHEGVGRVTLPSLAKLFGISESHVGNLRSTWAKLVPQLRDKFGSLGFEAPVAEFIRISKLDPSFQVKEWEKNLAQDGTLKPRTRKGKNGEAGKDDHPPQTDPSPNPNAALPQDVQIADLEKNVRALFSKSSTHWSLFKLCPNRDELMQLVFEAFADSEEGTDQ